MTICCLSSRYDLNHSFAIPLIPFQVLNNILWFTVSKALRRAVQYALDSGFTETLELKSVQEGALLNFVKREDVNCGAADWTREIFNLTTGAQSLNIYTVKVFEYSKAAVLVVVCPLSALLDSKDLDRGFAAYNRSCDAKKKTLWHPARVASDQWCSSLVAHRKFINPVISFWKYL